MITEVKDIDPRRCGWEKVPRDSNALEHTMAISFGVDNVVNGAERRHFGYLCLMFYREELA